MSAMSEALARVHEAGRLGHAYLFVGPSEAAIGELIDGLLARLLCGEEGACGACRSCELLSRGEHPDLARLEPEEGKRNIVIDQVRGLERALAAVPDLARRRVAMIPRADSMNLETANALLKTLEEPPGRAVLLLTARRRSGVPRTVRSRCQILYVPPQAGSEDRMSPQALAHGALILGQGPAEAVAAAVLGNSKGADARKLALAALDAAARELGGRLRDPAAFEACRRGLPALWDAMGRIESNVSPAHAIERAALDLRAGR